MGKNVLNKLFIFHPLFFFYSNFNIRYSLSNLGPFFIFTFWYNIFFIFNIIWHSLEKNL